MTESIIFSYWWVSSPISKRKKGAWNYRMSISTQVLLLTSDICPRMTISPSCHFFNYYTNSTKKYLPQYNSPFTPIAGDVITHLSLSQTPATAPVC